MRNVMQNRGQAIFRFKFLLIPAALLGLSGCASFNSGDLRVDRDTARAMMEDRALTPFSELQVYWRNFPYRAPTESIGEGSISNPKQILPSAPPADDLAAFARRAREIFGDAGLYDRKKGRGTLRLELTSVGRWTYGDLWRSYLVETGFIFIIPSSLRVNYFLTADFATSSGTVRVEAAALNKTTFHLLLAPLYPLFPPGARENGLLRQLLWRAATDVYARLRTAGQAPEARLPEPAEIKIDRSLSGPPLPPDRTWLPGETGTSSPDIPAIKPVEPDKTWIAPTKHAPSDADAQIKPAAADRRWDTETAPVAPDKTWAPSGAVIISSGPTAPAITPAPSDRGWVADPAADAEQDD